MAVFDFDLRYAGGKWAAECTWRDGDGDMYGYDRRLNLRGEGSKPDEAVENLVELMRSLLVETERRIRSEFEGFEF